MVNELNRIELSGFISRYCAIENIHESLYTEIRFVYFALFTMKYATGNIFSFICISLNI